MDVGCEEWLDVVIVCIVYELGWSEVEVLVLLLIDVVVIVF